MIKISLNKKFWVPIISSLAISFSLQAKPSMADEVNFNWSYNGDGYGEASLSFFENEVSQKFSDLGGTGTFTSSDLGENASFNYYL